MTRCYCPRKVDSTARIHCKIIWQQCYVNGPGIDRASSHSGRRTLATNLLHDQGEHLKTVQKVLGHKSAATTTIYQDVTEQEIKHVLKKAGKNYDN